MFSFNLPAFELTRNNKASKGKNIYLLPTPRSIRAELEHLSRCNNCHFLIYENYWEGKIEKASEKVCPTCGEKTS